jgi:hypothetical protein
MLNSPNLLNAPTRGERLAALRSLAEARAREGAQPPLTREVNCHVHTSYSFSPYSPAFAAERAHAAGLLAVGIMDHDSMAGAAEMREAGMILGIATTAGVEFRVNATGTRLEGRKINSPDSTNILYMMMHGVPSRSIAAVRRFLAPIQAAREKRSRRIVERLNGILGERGIQAIDFQQDVAAQSQAAEGGTITERHILFAAARKIVAMTGRGAPLVRFLRSALAVRLPARVEGWLLDESNPVLLYDLLGLLKSSFIDSIYIQPDQAECGPAAEAVRFALSVGAIPCYPYLGDVTDSPTGDKKAESFEDAYLEELFPEVVRLGFRAVAYMPPRNTPAQIARVQRMCASHGLMEISGVDINSPRQSFNCPELMRPEFSHLLGATWALIAHERLADAHERYGLFHPGNPLAALPIAERLAAYAEVGRTLDHRSDEPADRHPLAASWG